MTIKPQPTPEQIRRRWAIIAFIAIALFIGVVVNRVNGDKIYTPTDVCNESWRNDAPHAIDYDSFMASCTYTVSHEKHGR